MPRLLAGKPDMSRPSNLISPLVGDSIPAIMFIVVLLPQPDGPSRATNSLSRIARDSWSTARTELNVLQRSISSIDAIFSAVFLCALMHGRACTAATTDSLGDRKQAQ